jgi:hypothetical protein
MLSYGFAYSPSSRSGGLNVYVGSTGEILGWSYAKSIDERFVRGTAYMYKRDFEK